jgi:7,8-dihydroneopterin aldolase/epimerase/oxygenase
VLLLIYRLCDFEIWAKAISKYQHPAIPKFSPIMLTVHLDNLRFFAQHGAYAGEAVTGGEFEVQVTVRYDEGHTSFDSLVNVVNYETIYQLVSKRMAMPTPLLEELAESIILKISHEYSFVMEITVSIFKLHPPIENFQGRVGVTLQKKFNHS